MNKFDECAEQFPSVGHKAFMEQIYHWAKEWQPVISEALEIASKLENNPYTLTKEEPFQINAKWDRKVVRYKPLDPTGE